MTTGDMIQTGDNRLYMAGRTKEGKLTISVGLLVKIIIGMLSKNDYVYHKNFGKYVEETYTEFCTNGRTQRYVQLLVDMKKQFGDGFPRLYKAIESELMRRYPEAKIAQTYSRESPDSTYIIYAKPDLYDEFSDRLIEYKVYSITSRNIRMLSFIADLQSFLYTYVCRKPVCLCTFVVDFDRHTIVNVSELNYTYHPTVDHLIPAGDIVEYYMQRLNG